MSLYREIDGSIYLVDRNVIVEEITDPVVLFDGDTLTVHKVGNRESVQDYISKVFKEPSVFPMTISSWRVIDLPKDVDILNKVVRHTGYIGHLLEEANIH